MHIASLLLAEAMNVCDDWTMVVCESPTNWFNDKGMASKDHESVQRLYWEVGAIVATLARMPHWHSCWTVSPAWKGQTPKPIMVNRCAQWLRTHERPAPTSHDMAEAILLSREAANLYLDRLAKDKPMPDYWARIGDMQDAVSVSVLY